MEGRPETILPAIPDLPTEMTLKILSNLDDRSLFSCRLVSRGWCQISSTILQDRPSVVVSFWLPQCSEKKNSLSNFIKCFKESREFRYPFPFTNFELNMEYSWTKEKCPDLELFFALSKESSSGLLIKCLSFYCNDSCSVTLRSLERIIFQDAPHLRILSLTLDDLGETESEEDSFGETIDDDDDDDETRPISDDNTTAADITLPWLRILQLDICYGAAAAVMVVTKILRAAPNLQRIEDPGCGFHKGFTYSVLLPGHLQPLIQAKKLHLVNNIRFDLNSDLLDSGLVTREKLSGFQPKVLDLGMDTVPRQQIKLAAQDLLWTAKDAVEELETDSCFGLLDNLDLPQLSKLRVWRLKCGEDPIFPPRMRILDTFPRLGKICLSFDPPKDTNTFLPAWSIPHIPVIHSVHSLEIESPATFAKQEEAKACLEFMALVCPNMQNLELFYPSSTSIDFTWLGPLIWTNMSRLQTLTLNTSHRYRWPEENSVEKMEAGFTGFSLETVRRLKATRAKRRPKVEKAEHLRVNPSILQMTELKKLILSEDLLGRGSQPSTPFLPLSFKYAFNLMPGLIVTIMNREA